MYTCGLRDIIHACLSAVSRRFSNEPMEEFMGAFERTAANARTAMGNLVDGDDRYEDPVYVFVPPLNAGNARSNPNVGEARFGSIFDLWRACSGRHSLPPFDPERAFSQPTFAELMAAACVHAGFTSLVKLTAMAVAEETTLFDRVLMANELIYTIRRRERITSKVAANLFNISHILHVVDAHRLGQLKPECS